MTVVIFHCFHFGGVKSYVKSVQKFKNSKKKIPKLELSPGLTYMISACNKIVIPAWPTALHR